MSENSNENFLVLTDIKEEQFSDDESPGPSPNIQKNASINTSGFQTISLNDIKEELELENEEEVEVKDWNYSIKSESVDESCIESIQSNSINLEESIKVKIEDDVEIKVVDFDMQHSNTDCIENFEVKKEISDCEENFHDSQEKVQIKHEEELEICDVATENELEYQILIDGMKNIGKMIKFSDDCSKKLAELDKLLHKWAEPSTFQNIGNPVQKIKKLIRVDPEDTLELSDEILDDYNLKKYSMNFERQEGSIVAVYNIPYLVCTACSTIFMSLNSFFTHYKLKHGQTEKPFKCKMCQIFYGTWKELKGHFKYHQENRSFSCKYCYFPFKVQESLERHMKRVHMDKIQKISCDICGRNFDDEKEMLIHKNQHKGRGKIITIGAKQTGNAVKTIGIKCIFCSMQFLKTENLELHYRSHKSLEKMKCRTCNRDVMVNPQYIIKNIKMREFKCISCTANSGSDKVNVQPPANVKIESGSDSKAIIKVLKIKPAEEPKSESDKVVVMNIDNDTKKLSVKCYICGMELSSNIRLFWHMKGHLEQHHFKCSVCHADFDTREAMIEHCKTEHDPRKMTKCDICKKQFHFVDFKTHLKTHKNKVEARTDSEIITITKVKDIRPVIKTKAGTSFMSTQVGVRTSPKTSTTTYINPNGPILHVIRQPEGPSSKVPQRSTSSTIKVDVKDSTERTFIYGSKCPKCDEYVLHKHMPIHQMKHDQEKTSKLIQRIQSGRKKEDLLNSLRKPSQKVPDIRPKFILKRKLDEGEESGMDKKAKVNEIS